MMHGLNTYDYGARQYNPVVSSWDRMDPLDKNAWYVAFGTNGMGYSIDGTLERRFQEIASENCWWKTISDTNTDISTGLGFAGWGIAKPLARGNVYAFRDGTGRYINSTKPTFSFLGKSALEYNDLDFWNK